jgi:hypothetical protein
VPGPSNPQALNRYSYGFNSPLKYTDPDGHCASDSSQGDSWCRPEEQHHENQQLGALTTHDFALQIRNKVNAGGLNSVVGLGQIVDFAWNFVKKDVADLMWVLSNVLLGIDPDYVTPASRPVNDALNSIGIPAYDQNDNPYWIGAQFLPDTDWFPGFQDGGNQQVVHFMFYALTSFYSGFIASGIGNVLHDPPTWTSVPCIPLVCANPRNEDWALGVAGNSYGAWLNEEARNPGALTVSPGSVLVEVLTNGNATVTNQQGTRIVGFPTR